MFISNLGMQYANQSNVKDLKFFKFAKHFGNVVNKLLFIVKVTSYYNFPNPSEIEIILLYEISIEVIYDHSFSFAGKQVNSLCAIEKT